METKLAVPESRREMKKKTVGIWVCVWENKMVLNPLQAKT